MANVVEVRGVGGPFSTAVENVRQTLLTGITNVTTQKDAISIETQTQIIFSGP